MWVAGFLAVVLTTNETAISQQTSSSTKVEKNASVDPFAAIKQSTDDRLESLRSEYHLPSISLAIRVDGKLAYANAVGWANVKKEIRATPKTVYSVGRIAKPLTAVAIMKLVQDGKLSLDDPIHKHVPDFPEKEHVFIVRQVASHTAGIVHGNTGRVMKGWFQPKLHKHPTEALDFFQNDKLLFEPGTKFSYSSSGYVLLSEVVAQAANGSYTEVMKELVLEPCGMKQTEHDTAEVGGGLEADYYVSVTEGQAVEAVSRRDRSFLFGGGGYISTPTDLVNFAEKIITNEYLSSETREAMFTPIKLSDGSINLQRYAIGWRTQTSTNLKIDGEFISTVHHGGTVSQAAHSYLLLFPEHNASIAYATNAIPAGADASNMLRNEMWVILHRYVEAKILPSSKPRRNL